MIDDLPCNITVRNFNQNDIINLIEGSFESIIGHESTLNVINQNVKKYAIDTEYSKPHEYQLNRKQVKLSKGDIVAVFQILQRLPEGKILNEKELQDVDYKLLVVEVN